MPSPKVPARLRGPVLEKRLDETARAREPRTTTSKFVPTRWFGRTADCLLQRDRTRDREIGDGGVAVNGTEYFIAPYVFAFLSPTDSVLNRNRRKRKKECSRRGSLRIPG